MDPQQYISQFKKKTGRLPSQVELSRELGLSPQNAILCLTKSIRNPAPEPVEKAPVAHVEPGNKWIMWGLLAISAVTFVLSVYFTGLWFRSMFGFFIAGSISVAMVSYMVLSPQAAAYVRGVVKIPLWTTFAIALVFSMGSTVAGQYNKLTESVDVAQVSDRALLDLLRREEDELVADIEVDRQQQQFHQETLQSLSDTAEARMENWAYISTERDKVAELGEGITQKRQRLEQVRSQIRQELESENVGVTEARSDFYTWFSGVIGMSRTQTEFLISSLPAIFIDVIAALSLNLALGMRRKG